ncbi:macrophage mannose receptor 1-like, partial [Arapaima gigas]
GNETCAVAWITEEDQGKWGDQQCGEKHPFLCYAQRTTTAGPATEQSGSFSLSTADAHQATSQCFPPDVTSERFWPRSRDPRFTQTLGPISPLSAPQSSYRGLRGAARQNFF